MYKLKEKFYKEGCSIIIPIWNSEPTIERCINSIFDAFPRNVKLEILFIDKGSTDRTHDIIMECLKYNPSCNISYRIIRESGVLGKVRIVGIENAQYGTIFWLDSDIILPKNYIKSLFIHLDWSVMVGEISSIGLDKIFGIQGYMESNCELWHKWWHGQEIINFKKWGFSLGSPTANLLVLNEYKLTHNEKAKLSKLHSQEDNFLSDKVRGWGFEIYQFDISTEHLEYDVISKEGDYKILWLIVAFKDMKLSRWKSIAKLKTIWFSKWIWARGLNSFRVYGDFRLLTLTFRIELNIIKALLKNKKILSQRRLKSLMDW